MERATSTSFPRFDWAPCQAKHWSTKPIILQNDFYWSQPVQSVDFNQDVTSNHFLIQVAIPRLRLICETMNSSGGVHRDHSGTPAGSKCFVFVQEFLTISWPNVQISALWTRLSLDTELVFGFVGYQYLWIIPHADTSAFNQIHGGSTTMYPNNSQEVQGLLAEERKRTQATEGEVAGCGRSPNLKIPSCQKLQMNVLHWLMVQAPKSHRGWNAACLDMPCLCQELQAEMCRFSEQNTAQAFEKELLGLAVLVVFLLKSDT